MNIRKLDDALAPRPVRRSYARSLYDAVASLSGPARVDQIIEMIPATDDANKWSAATPDRVVELLRSAEIHGYLKFNEATGRWNIAPRKYFEACQLRIREQAANRLAHGKIPQDMPKGHRAASKNPFPVVVEGPTELAFMAGVAVGVLTVLAGFGVYALIIGGL